MWTWSNALYANYLTEPRLFHLYNNCDVTFLTVFILTHPVNFPRGRKPERLEKTHDFPFLFFQHNQQYDTLLPIIPCTHELKAGIAYCLYLITLNCSLQRFSKGSPRKKSEYPDKACGGLVRAKLETRFACEIIIRQLSGFWGDLHSIDVMLMGFVDGNFEWKFYKFIFIPNLEQSRKMQL
jgi:hypothetical protein